MKTLKKTLCLVLAVVMVVGVLVLPAGAANYDDYLDKDEIKHTTAVKVLTALGIIEGNESGSFKPEEELTRAQGATILAKTILGSSAAYLDNSSSPFSDVPAGHWAAGVVSYAAAEGIINGGGDGKFYPNETLTGYELAKLLLVAMGVDGTYTGENWKIDVGLNAAKVGLLKELDITLAEPIHRDDAVQMTFNALIASVSGTVATNYVVTLEVTEDGKKVTKELYNGTNETIAMAYMIQNPGAEMKENSRYVDSLGNSVFGLNKDTTKDDFQRVYTTWLANGNVKVVLDSAPALAYDEAKTAAQIGTAMGVSSVNKAFTLNVYVDGELDETLSKAYTRSGENGKTVLGGRGAHIEVYDATSDPNAPVFNVYVINTYVQKLAKADIVAAVKADATHDAADAYIKLNAGGKELAYTTNEYKEGNVVLFTHGKEAAHDVRLATPVNGKITRYNKDANVTVDGVLYNIAGKTLGDTYSVIPSGSVFNTDYVFYVDDLSNVYGREAIETANVVNIDGYVYVDNYQVHKDGSSSDLFNEGVADSYAIKATVTDVDGTRHVVDVAVDSKTSGDVTTFSWNKPNTNGVVAAENLTAAVPLTAVGGWVAYNVKENGEYVFQSVSSVAEVANVSKASGATTITVGGNSKVMTSTSTLDVINTADNTHTTTVGYRSIEIADNTKALVVYTNVSKTVVSAVYVVTDKPVDKSTPYNFAYFVGYGASVDGGTEVTFYVGGGVETYISASSTDYTEGHVYDISVNENGVVTKKSEQTSTESGLVSLVDEGYALIDKNTEHTETVADDTAVVFESNTVVYNATTNGAGVEDTVEVGDTILVVKVDGKVAVIFITAEA